MKSKLLILDAGVIIRLHSLGRWEQVVEKFDVYISEAVVVESKHDESYKSISLADRTDITIFSTRASELSTFLNQFDDVYKAAIHRGEHASLTYLFKSSDDFLISSTDKIVYKVLGLLGKSEQGVSVEDMLRRIGITDNRLEWNCTEEFREKYTKDGERDKLTDRGLKKNR